MTVLTPACRGEGQAALLGQTSVHLGKDESNSYFSLIKKSVAKRYVMSAFVGIIGFNQA